MPIINPADQVTAPPVITYHIFPPVGLARLGNSTADANASPPGYYLSPETPQTDFVPVGGYRDASGKIRRMGQRFRIYEYVNNIPSREITSALATIKWSVRLANSKATNPDARNPAPVPPQTLTIDTGNQAISGNNQKHAMVGKFQPAAAVINVPLGDLLTDNDGRLIILGGFGTSASWNGSGLSGLFSPGWYDDVSDGPVIATVQLNGSASVVATEAAWVIVGPPDYAHAIRPIVSIFDLAKSVSQPPIGQTSFLRDIYPVLRATVFLQWSNKSARSGHHDNPAGDFLSPTVFPKMHDKQIAGGTAARERVFSKLKKPGGGGGNMPALNNLTVTPRQYEHFTQWKAGNYTDDWDPAWSTHYPPELPLQSYPVSQQPYLLTLAALDKGIGGSFMPGMEADKIIGVASTYKAPFRIADAVKPGDLTRTLSVPWQADFAACTEGWWPSSRPGTVFAGAVPVQAEWSRGADSADNMLKNWSKLGFVVRDPSNPLMYTEQQRTL